MSPALGGGARSDRTLGHGGSASRATVLAGGIVAVLLALATAAASSLAVRSGDGSADIRLSWRTEPLRVEECRALTAEEQARMPAHMRRTEECTGYYVDYELRLEVDGLEPVVDTVAPSGLRRDRPVYVLRDIPVPTGEHRVDVTFTALVPADFASDDGPVRLDWSGTMSLGPGEIGLITLDETGRDLLRRERSGGP